MVNEKCAGGAVQGRNDLATPTLIGRTVLMASLDYATFAHPAFDANEYANAILAAQPYRISSTAAPTDTSSKVHPTTIDAAGTNKEEISVALAKLSFGIDDVSRQLKNVINVHHEALLSQAASVNQLEGSLQHVNTGLKDISTSVTRLRTKLSTPYTALQAHVTRLQKLQVASDVLRRVARFFMLSRRLEVQMKLVNRASNPSGATPTPMKEYGDTIRSPMTPLAGAGEDQTEEEKERARAIIKAALSVAEIFVLVDASPSMDEHGEQDGDKDSKEAERTSMELPMEIPPISLRALNVISSHIPHVQAAREHIVGEMEAMLVTGVQELNRSLLSSALLTAHNLRILPETVQNLVGDLIQVVETRVKNAFDMAALGREKGLKEAASAASAASNLLYRSRVRTDPTNVTAPQWANAFWARLETMVADLGEACIKVYTLEKVLLIQKDLTTGQSFLDEVMAVLENKPSASFWSTLARTLERSCREGAKTSTFLSQTLTSQYPRLLRLFQDFFSRISLHTETVYTQSYQSPETVLTLRSVATFESQYLQRSTNKLNELISNTFATSASAYLSSAPYVSGGGYMVSSTGGGTKAMPTEKEGLAIARIVLNELDTAKFDPLLVKATAKGMVKCLETLQSRVDNLAVRDRSATTLVGPSATTQQLLNASMVNVLYHCWLQLSKLPETFSEGVVKVLEPAILALQETYLHIAEPLLSTVRLDISTIIARVHRIDFGDTDADGMSQGMGGSSMFLKELAEKLSYVRREILSRYNVGELGQEWGLDLARHTLRTFVLHISIVKPLGETGKLQLTSDMTELEFALSSLLAEGVAQGSTKQRWKLDVLGADYKALRAMRHLLFLSDESLSEPDQTSGLPPLVILHHILVRSPLPLPHRLHGWQESQYVRFVEEHTDEEVWSVLEQGLKHWRTSVLSEIEDAEDAGPAGAAKKREKEGELRGGERFVQLAAKVLEHARRGIM